MGAERRGLAAGGPSFGAPVQRVPNCQAVVAAQSPEPWPGTSQLLPEVETSLGAGQSKARAGPD